MKKHIDNIVLFMILVALAGCRYGDHDVHERRFMMGTMVDFTVASSQLGEAQVRQAIALAAQTMQQIEQQMSIYGSADNTVKQLNRAPVGQSVRVDARVDRVLQQALAVELASHGAFSPALAAFNLLWGFSLPVPPTQPPAAERIKSLLSDYASQCLKRTGRQQWQRQSAACQADLGGIAKGYALDVGMSVLQHQGIRNAMINAGGDIRLSGSHRGQPWRIGVRDPRQHDGVLAVLALSGDMSVVTSGDYERFFMFNGQRYHHILDPQTGYPARHYRSVTVVAPSAMIADAWSTALFAGGESLTHAINTMAWMTLDANGLLASNPLMKQYLVAPSR